MLEKGFCDVIPLDILDGAMEALLAFERRFLLLTWVSLMVPKDARLLMLEIATRNESRSDDCYEISIHFACSIQGSARGVASAVKDLSGKLVQSNNTCSQR